MAESIGARLRKAWNAFTSKDSAIYRDLGPSYYTTPGMRRTFCAGDKTIINSIYNRISLDVAGIDIRHVYLDENKRYIGDATSHLNECLTIEPNIDQTPRAFFQDCVLTMLEKGCAAIVPIETDENVFSTNSYDIYNMRVGYISEWYPRHVKVKVFNEKSGHEEEIVLLKNDVAIIQNPLYSVINAPNGTMQRLLHKLALLDAVDEANSSGKLDLIIQLPYTVRTDLRREQANNRRKEIEDQLYNSKYGVAYTDGTEKITQLNRPVENNLWAQIESLTSMLYGQLGMTDTIINGTADEKVMLNYYNRTIEPFVSAITDEMKRKFLTPTARSQGQSIVFFRNPFKLVPVAELADIADKFTRNEIMTSNEFRQIIGMKPSSDPEADVLRNKNLNPSDAQMETEFDEQHNQNQPMEETQYE